MKFGITSSASPLIANDVGFKVGDDVVGQRLTDGFPFIIVGHRLGQQIQVLLRVRHAHAYCLVGDLPALGNNHQNDGFFIDRKQVDIFKDIFVLARGQREGCQIRDLRKHTRGVLNRLVEVAYLACEPLGDDAFLLLAQLRFLHQSVDI